MFKKLLLGTFIGGLLLAAPLQARAMETMTVVWVVAGNSPGGTSIQSWEIMTTVGSHLTGLEIVVPRPLPSTPSVAVAYGVPGDGKISADGTRLAYLFNDIAVPAKTKIIFALEGLANPAEAGWYSTQISTVDGGRIVETATSDSQEFSGESAGVSVVAFVLPNAGSSSVKASANLPALNVAGAYKKNGPTMLPTARLAVIATLALWLAVWFIGSKRRAAHLIL
jgi:hypothetical protein